MARSRTEAGADETDEWLLVFLQFLMKSRGG